MKILVITITCNRLETTKKYIGQLKEKGGYKFEHLVVDNGSTDGTVEWLKENGYNVIANDFNEGIVKAWIKGVKMARMLGFEPDLVVKFDDDCEIETDGILKNMVEFYQQVSEHCILAPVDLEIEPDFVPQVVDDSETLGWFNVRITTHTGGIFTMVPIEAFDDMAKQNGGNGIEKDQKRGEFWREQDGFKNVYLTDLKVHHRGIGKTNYNNYKF